MASASHSLSKSREHIPELKWIYGYPFSLSLMTGIDLSLVYMFKKAKWL